jgi:hypothetical protein
LETEAATKKTCYIKALIIKVLCRSMIAISPFHKSQLDMKNFFRPLSIATALMLTLTANAQIQTPAPSTTAQVKQPIGLADVTLDYSRPSSKGRKIMGDLVPFGELWRLGANSATKITITDSLTVAGKGLPKGTWVVMARPGKDEWEIIFNKNGNASVFNRAETEKDDYMSVKVRPTTINMNVETYTMGFGNVSSGSADLQIMWENTLVSVPMVNDYDKKVMAQIKSKLDGPSQQDYFAMSTYYFDNGKDIKEALNFVNKALDKGERFWMLRHKSLVLAKMGDKAGAVAAAKRSLELSKEAKNNDYIRMNEKSIAEWSK